MSNAEIFNTATWNFLSGDRAVEDILKDKRLSRITVRGGIGSVLPTLAAIKDISKLGWKDPVEGALHVPSNSLSLHSPSLQKKTQKNMFYETLLKESFGVEILKEYRPFPEQLIIIMNMTEENKRAKNILPEVLGILKKVKDNRVIFTCPRNKKILSPLRPYAQKAWSNIYWDGLNAFFSSQVEEAVLEGNPKKILIAGAGKEHVFYTAIGAIDYFIIEDSQFREPSSLELWDIIEIGKKVSIISNPGGDEKKGTDYLENMVLSHMENILKIDSVIPDYAYSTVADHKIMIDIA